MPNAISLSPSIAATLRPDVQAMQAYAVQDAAGLIKLDAMENPFELPPDLQQALGDRLGRVALNRYPGDNVMQLREALARHTQLPAGCALMLGNGSDELISLLALACARPNACVLAPEPGFVMYAVSARLQGLRYVGVPLTADFELDDVAMLAAVAEHHPAITYIAYPNNPTANLFDDARVERIVRAVGEQGGLVVIDEAYQPFASRTWWGRLGEFEHLLVLRTFSKWGLAGARLGYLAGAEALINELDKVRPPYNVNVLSAEAGLFALEHADEYARQARVLRAERERLQAALRALPGVTPYPSEANMLLVRVPDAARTFEGLRARGVLVKNVEHWHPLLARCLRLTVGSPDDNSRMLTALAQSL